MKIINKCYMCHSSVLKKLYIINNCDIAKCIDCGLVFCTACEMTEISELYQDYNNNYDNEIEQFEIAGKRNYELFLRSVPNFEPENSLLDFGCGMGYFLTNFKIPDNKEGFEISKYQVNHARSLGIKVHNNQIREFISRGTKFQFITINQVIEHIADPISILRNLRQLLTETGELFLTTPNYKGLTSRITKSRWLVLYPPLHLYYFDPVTIQLILKEAGFQIKTLITENINPYNILMFRKIFSENRDEIGKNLQKIKYGKRKLGKLSFWMRDKINYFIRYSALGDNIIVLAKKT